MAFYIKHGLFPHPRNKIHKRTPRIHREIVTVLIAALFQNLACLLHRKQLETGEELGTHCSGLAESRSVLNGNHRAGECIALICHAGTGEEERIDDEDIVGLFHNKTGLLMNLSRGS